MKISERKLNKPLVEMNDQSKEYFVIARRIAQMIKGGARYEDYIPLLIDVRLKSIEDKILLKGDICVNLFLQFISDKEHKCSIPIEKRGKRSRISRNQLIKAKNMIKSIGWKKVAEIMGITPQGLRKAIKREKIIN